MVIWKTKFDKKNMAKWEQIMHFSAQLTMETCAQTSSKIRYEGSMTIRLCRCLIWEEGGGGGYKLKLVWTICPTCYSRSTWCYMLLHPAFFVRLFSTNLSGFNIIPLFLHFDCIPFPNDLSSLIYVNLQTISWLSLFIHTIIAHMPVMSAHHGNVPCLFTIEHSC